MMPVADRIMAAFNRVHRGKRHATDVLTFVYARRPMCVGEIYIGRGVARRQARERKVTIADEVRRLCIHGLAHLAGYDHRTVPQFAAMRKREFEALMTIL